MIISGFFTNLYGTEFGGRPNAYKKDIFLDWLRWPRIAKKK
jgi:hypothetical protein